MIGLYDQDKQKEYRISNKEYRMPKLQGETSAFDIYCSLFDIL